MKKVLVLLGILATFAGHAVARKEKCIEKNRETITQDNPRQADKDVDLTDQKVKPGIEQAVDEALKAVKRSSPQIHEDALRVWKNFSPTSRPVNFTYRFWGRRIVLWLKEEKKMTFESEQQVGEVFKVLWRKKLISEHAVFVLMADAWSHLIYLEGVPSWEKRTENARSVGKASLDISSEGKPGERAI